MKHNCTVKSRTKCNFFFFFNYFDKTFYFVYQCCLYSYVIPIEGLGVGGYGLSLRWCRYIALYFVMSLNENRFTHTDTEIVQNVVKLTSSSKFQGFHVFRLFYEFHGLWKFCTLREFRNFRGFCES